MKRALIIILFVAVVAAESKADGKMYWYHESPPDIPYQRALILFEDGTETLILQSNYKIPKISDSSEIGWVVPVPAVPEVTSMPADIASFLFSQLNRSSQPRITRISPIVYTVLYWVIAILSLLTFILSILSSFMDLPPRSMNRRRVLFYLSFLGLFLCFTVGVTRQTLSAGPALYDVDVIAEHRVGIFDVSVVRSDDAKDLIDWLNNHEFKFKDSDIAAFDSYVKNKWCFVVAIINPKNGEHKHQIAYEGLAAPLILRFPHDHPVYPVVLTGTGGYETEILIYLASYTRMTCFDRLTLRYAGKMREDTLKPLFYDIEPKGFFDPKIKRLPYLCKFKDRLTPEQMQQDIVFSESEKKNAYREHVTVW